MKKFVRTLAAILSAALLMGTVTGCSGTVSMEDYSTTVAATYGDEEIYLDEVNFFLRYLQWYQEESYWEIYETYLGYDDMWEADSGNGSMTLGEYLKEVVMAQTLQTRILLDHTEDYDIELTDEDVELAEEAVADLRDDLADEFTNYSDASDEDILGWFEENLLANKVYEAVRQSAEVEITDEECQMFTIQYVYVSVTEEDEEEEEDEEDTDEEADEESEDEDSDSEEEDEDELINEDLAEAVLACLEAGEDFDSIEDALGVSYTETSYLIAETDDDSELFTYGSEMSTGEAVLFESEDGGWYVVYCVSDLDEEATEEQREELEDEQREEYFEEVYAEWAEDAPEFTVKKVWDKIVVGGGKIYVEKEDDEDEEEETAAEETESETETETIEETTTATETTAAEETTTTAEESTAVETEAEETTAE